MFRFLYFNFVVFTLIIDFGESLVILFVSHSTFRSSLESSQLFWYLDPLQEVAQDSSATVLVPLSDLPLVPWLTLEGMRFSALGEQGEQLKITAS